MELQRKEMENVARLYCELIDATETADSSWFQQLSELLPRLHMAVTSLKGRAGNVSCMGAVDLDARFELFSSLRHSLGEHDGYWLEFDLNEGFQCMSGSLADDLTDIYCELKSGLRILDGEPDMALDDWQSSYKVHWGQHLVDAERHIYNLQARGI